MNFNIIPVREHYEIYLDGEFFCSADTDSEAAKDIEEFMNKFNE